MIDFETNERLNACEHYIDVLNSEILRLKHRLVKAGIEKEPFGNYTAREILGG